jgi:IclR helix-turn-helix domain
VADWSFLTSHARVLPCFARDPGVRLRDIVARTGVTERTAYGIVTDLTEAGYVVKHKDGRRNRYQIQAHLLLPETDSRERTTGETLVLLTGADGQGDRIIPVALTGERHRRRRHLVTPGTVITPQSTSANGHPVPGRAQQAGGSSSKGSRSLRGAARTGRSALACMCTRGSSSTHGIGVLLAPITE